MRFLLLLLCFLSTPALALEVLAAGFGNNYAEALQNAKIVALDKVNGAWINGDSYVRNGMFSEKITQYNGGVIRTYEVMKNDTTFVIIKADVVPRASNTMTTNSTTVPTEMSRELDGRRDNYKSRQEAIRVIDNRERALAFDTTNIRYENYGDDTIVIITGKVSLQKMWANSYAELFNAAGYFDMEGFYKPLYVSITGFDHGKIITNTTNRFYDELSVYKIAPFGVVVNPKVYDLVELKIKVKTDVLKSINTFTVNFI